MDVKGKRLRLLYSDVLGVEPNGAMLLKAQAKVPGAVFEVGDLRRLPAANASHDGSRALVHSIRSRSAGA